jgi:hypothetical protein
VSTVVGTSAEGTAEAVAKTVGAASEEARAVSTVVGTSAEVTAEAVAKMVGAATEEARVAVAKGTSDVSWIPPLISSSSCATAPPLLGSFLIVIFLFIKNLDMTCPAI